MTAHPPLPSVGAAVGARCSGSSCSTSARWRSCWRRRSGARTTSPATINHTFTTRELQDALHRPGVPHGRDPHRRRRGARDADRPDARAADRVLRRQGRRSVEPSATPWSIAAHHAAVGELSGQGVRLARHADPRRRRRLGAEAARACTDRASAYQQPSSPCPTCGCPTWCCRSTPALERLPQSLLEASADLGASAGGRSARVVLAAASCRASSPARSSRSRCRSVTTSWCRSSAARPSCSPTSSTTASRPPATCRSRPPLPSFPITVVLLYLFAVRRTGALENL